MHIDTKSFSHIKSGKRIHLICNDGCIRPRELYATAESACLSLKTKYKFTIIVTYIIITHQLLAVWMSQVTDHLCLFIKMFIVTEQIQCIQSTV